MQKAFPLRQICLALLLSGLILYSAAFALDSDRGLLDFGSFVMAAESRSRGLDPYAIDKELAAETGFNFGYTDGRGYSLNLNPPISVYLFQSLVHADPMAVRNVLTLLSLGLFTAICAILARKYPWQRRTLVYLWAFSLGGLWHLLWLGQIYVFLLAVAAGAWFLLEREERPVLAGLLIGLLIAIKPNFAIWPLMLLAIPGQRKTTIVAFGVAALVSAVPVALDGPEIYARWLAAIQGYERTGIAVNASLMGTAARLGVPGLGVAAVAMMVCGLIALVWHRKPAAADISSLALVAVLLAGPLTSSGYAIFAIPVLLARRWGPAEWVVALALAFPTWLMGIEGWSFQPSAEVAVSGLLLLLTVQIRDILAPGEPAKKDTHTTATLAQAA